MSLSLEKGLRLLQAPERTHRTRVVRPSPERRRRRERARQGDRVPPAALALAQAAFKLNRVVRRTLGLMRSLHEVTDETINLAERHDLASVTIHEIPSSHQVRYTTRIGAAAPLHLGASSRTTVAFSPPPVREAVFAPLARSGRRPQAPHGLPGAAARPHSRGSGHALEPPEAPEGLC